MPYDGGVDDAQSRMFLLDEQGLVEGRGMGEFHVGQPAKEIGGGLRRGATHLRTKEAQRFNKHLGGNHKRPGSFDFLARRGVVDVIHLEQGKQATGVGYSGFSRSFQYPSPATMSRSFHANGFPPLNVGRPLRSIFSGSPANKARISCPSRKPRRWTSCLRKRKA